jgi:hypothetical protein
MARRTVSVLVDQERQSGRLLQLHCGSGRPGTRRIERAAASAAWLTALDARAQVARALTNTGKRLAPCGPQRITQAHLDSADHRRIDGQLLQPVLQC